MKHLHCGRCYCHREPMHGFNRESGTMRMIIMAAIAAAALCCGSGGAQAWEGNSPWCAYIDIGTGTVYEKCTYR